MAELQPWQQPGETSKAYQAFNVYKDLEPSYRSQQRVPSECTKSVSLIRRWSALWNWVERAAAWDEEIFLTARNKGAKILSEGDLTDASLEELRLCLDVIIGYLRQRGVLSSSLDEESRALLDQSIAQQRQEFLAGR